MNKYWSISYILHIIHVLKNTSSFVSPLSYIRELIQFNHHVFQNVSTDLIWNQSKYLMVIYTDYKMQARLKMDE